MMFSNMSVAIPPVWHLVREIRNNVGTALEAHSPDFRSAAMMTASELLENAIKYGEAVTGATDILFTMTRQGDVVRIEIVNGCTNSRAVDTLLRMVDELSRTEDKGALYLKRLEQLLAAPMESGRLGLYRIAFEGQFDLTCTYQRDVVSVAATRKAT